MRPTSADRRDPRVTVRLQHPALPATAESLALLGERHSRFRPFASALLRNLWPLTWEGEEHVPREGPLVVLANHVQFPDSVTMNVVANRPVVVMGTESMTQGNLGRVALYFGLSPKKKNMADAKAVRLLKSWVDLGAAVGIFPEGERTWDGRPLPLIPGIEKLVLLLRAPVVTMRIYNGYRQWPRWAALPRRGRVHVVVDPPVVFDKRQGAEAVAAELARRLRVSSDEAPSWPVWGPGLANGITNVLYACPSCGRVEALVASGGTVACGACRDRWRVTSASTLIGPGGERSLAQLVDQLGARLEQEGWRDPQAGERALLQSESCMLFDETGDQPSEVGAGRLTLTPERIWLDGTSGWTLPLSELAAANVENRRRLWLRTRDGRLFEPILPRESVRKWEQFIEHWRLRGAPDATNLRDLPHA